LFGFPAQWFGFSLFSFRELLAVQLIRILLQELLFAPAAPPLAVQCVIMHWFFLVFHSLFFHFMFIPVTGIRVT